MTKACSVRSLALRQGYSNSSEDFTRKDGLCTGSCKVGVPSLARMQPIGRFNRVQGSGTPPLHLEQEE